MFLPHLLGFFGVQVVSQWRCGVYGGYCRCNRLTFWRRLDVEINVLYSRHHEGCLNNERVVRTWGPVGRGRNSYISHSKVDASQSSADVEYSHTHMHRERAKTTMVILCLRGEYITLALKRKDLQRTRGESEYCREGEGEGEKTFTFMHTPDDPGRRCQLYIHVFIESHFLSMWMAGERREHENSQHSCELMCTHNPPWWRRPWSNLSDKWSHVLCRTQTGGDISNILFCVWGCSLSLSRDAAGSLQHFLFILFVCFFRQTAHFVLFWGKCVWLGSNTRWDCMQKRA